jgi:hypothetical protein
MRTLVLMFGCLLALGLTAAADHPSAATLSDVRALQADLELLDDSLAELDPGDPSTREYRQRADRIRDDVVRLRDDIQAHRRSSREGLGASASEVRALRRTISDLRDDIDASAGTSARRASGDVTIPDGTLIPIRLETSVSSRTARPEDRVEGTVAQSVRVGGSTAVPAGSRVLGIVRDAEPAERVARAGRLEIEFDRILLPQGASVDIDTRVVRLNEGLDKSETGKKAGLGALLGGVLGGVIDGKSGALIGVLVGAGGGLVASRGEDVELPAGTVLDVRLERAAIARR